MVQELIMSENLCKHFGRIKALREFNVKIGKGVWGLIGPNGAGKTTFIRLVLGLLKPTCGKVTAFQYDCWEDSLKIRKMVGVLHERPVYPGNMEVERYLETVARFYDLENPNEAVMKALKRVNLKQYSKRKISSLSAGMLKRLGLAQAMIHNPRLIILDEPTANLDVIGRIEFLERIKTMSKSGINFLISSHVLPELQEVCDHIVLIYNGKAVISGNVSEILSRNLSNFWILETSDPEKLSRELRKMGYETNIQGELVKVSTENSTQLALDASTICVKERIKLISFNPETSNLLDFFKRLIHNESNSLAKD